MRQRRFAIGVAILVGTVAVGGFAAGATEIPWAPEAVLHTGLAESRDVVAADLDGDGDNDLARISHRSPAAATDAPQVAALAIFRVLQPTRLPMEAQALSPTTLTGGARGPYVLSSPPPRSSGRNHHISRRLDRLATNLGEISGLVVATGADGVLWLENSANWISHPVDGTLDTVRSVAVADVDSDGELALAVATDSDVAGAGGEPFTFSVTSEEVVVEPLFADGFEDQPTDAWSAVVP